MTMTTVSDRLYHLGGVPVGGPITQGKVFFVRPYSGSDTASGKNPREALKTLSRALALATADQNDIVYLLSEGNASAKCTDYQVASAPLDWNKDGVHLIGINAGGRLSPRSRIAWAATTSATTDTALLTVSASNCLIQGISVYAGINDANLSFGVNVTGHRNRFVDCHLAGIGHDTNDVAGAYSLRLGGGTENLFDHCVIGLDTIARGTAANSEILVAAAGTADCNARNAFRDCMILSYAEATTHKALIRPSAGHDRAITFERCTFVNTGTSVMAEAFDVTAGGAPAGVFFVKDCSFFRYTDVESAAVSGIVYVHGAPVAAADNSLAAVTAAS
jgi:hypothetical protein